MLHPRALQSWSTTVTLSTRSGALDHADELEQLQHAQGTQVVGWSYAAAVTFLIYDIILTIDDEVSASVLSIWRKELWALMLLLLKVRLIWPNPWTLTKVAFFVIRYFPVVLEMSTQFYGAPLLTYSPRGCYAWNVYQGLGAVLVVAAVDYILLLRVLAMYPRNKYVRYISTIIYLAEIVLMSVGLAIAVPQLIFDEHCVVSESPTTFLIASACPIAYQTFLFIVTMCKFVGAVRSGWGSVPIVQLLARDGTWAFMLLFGVAISEAALYALAAEAYTGFLYGWLNTALSICGYRILLNLHDLNRKSPGRLFPTNAPGSSTYDPTSPHIQFTSIMASNMNSTLGGTISATDPTYESYEMSSRRSLGVQSGGLSDKEMEKQRETEIGDEAVGEGTTAWRVDNTRRTFHSDQASSNRIQT